MQRYNVILNTAILSRQTWVNCEYMLVAQNHAFAFGVLATVNWWRMGGVTGVFSACTRTECGCTMEENDGALQGCVTRIGPAQL